MDLGNISFFKLANQELQYLTERQKVLAENIANVNTPGYLAKDLKKPNFSDTLNSSVSMKVTNEKHLAAPISRGGASGNVYTPKPQNALTIDGNGVILEDQLNEAAKTKGDYNRLLTIYGKYTDMIKAANTRISG